MMLVRNVRSYQGWSLNENLVKDPKGPQTPRPGQDVEARSLANIKMRNPGHWRQVHAILKILVTVTYIQESKTESSKKTSYPLYHWKKQTLSPDSWTRVLKGEHSITQMLNEPHGQVENKRTNESPTPMQLLCITTEANTFQQKEKVKRQIIVR